MGSEAAVDSAACAARRSCAGASAYNAAEISGCANRTAGPSGSVASRPSSAAWAVSASAFSRPAVWSRATVGRAPALATSSVRRASAGSMSSLLSTNARSDVGTGSGSPGLGGVGFSASARPNSSANKGFPPLVRWISRTVERGSPAYPRWSSSPDTCARDSGLSRNARVSGGDALRYRSYSWPSVRTANTICTCVSPSRRAANPSNSALAGSSHCRSSATTRTGPSAARARSADRTARRRASPSRWREDSPRPVSADSSAVRCAAGSRSDTSSRTRPRRSARARKGRCDSDSVAEQRNTVRAVSPYSAANARRRVDFPIPAGPWSSTLPPSASWSRAAENISSRPMTRSGRHLAGSLKSRHTVTAPLVCRVRANIRQSVLEIRMDGVVREITTGRHQEIQSSDE